ncbi:MAG: DNA-3-methyladenine glycosylase family protein [Terriglobales bacterium]
MRGTNHQPAIRELKKGDAVLGAIIERVGACRISYGNPTFHALAEAILYQQLNGKAAETIFNRFSALAGDPLTPQGILKLTDAEMRGVGLSRQKTAYLRDLADKTRAGLLEFERLPELTDQEVIAHLTQVKGIGVWTAHMFLMFSLRRPDILPTGDYGIQAAIKKHYKKRKWPKPAVIEKIAKPWAPYRSIACWYLWRSLDLKTL